MSENSKMYRKSTIGVALILGALFIFGSVVLATSVDRMALTNLEGYPGETIKAEISLEGTEPEERSGFWYAYYKETAGDSEKMDITSWITFEPENYTIKEGEVKSFVVNVRIPKDAEPGLWGATTEEAGREGYSDERRTYIVFKDALADGNVYSGLLIPISVKVSASPNALVPIINFIRQNILVIILIVIILGLLVNLFFKKKKLSQMPNR